MRYDTENLKITKVEREFKEEIENLHGKFPLVEGEEKIEEKWLKIKISMITTASEVLGERKKERWKTWYDEECRMVMQEREESGKKTLERRTRRNVKEYEDIRCKTKNVI